MVRGNRSDGEDGDDRLLGLPRRVSRRPRPEDDGRARRPRTLVPSAWMLPDASQADGDGVVGVGADLSPPTLVEAYRGGLFPWPHPGIPLPWFSPDPRGLLELDGLHVSRSLRRRLRTSGWTTTVDRDFDAVVAACAAPRPGEDDTWITPAMRRAYGRLHELGWAHSVEVWEGHRLVGGVYGVQVGGIFTGESMFHRTSDASKVVLVDLAWRLAEAGGDAIDVQLVTPHLASLGAVEVPRADFLTRLGRVRDLDVRLLTAELPVSRLAARPGHAGLE